MANRQDIAAGRAFVELYLKDGKFTQGLKAASQKMRAFGASVTQMGAILTGVGGTIAAPLVAATKSFADTGDKLNKMAARTGLSTKALSELGFAAEQSGASIDVVEKGIRRMQKTLVDAADGTATATDALERLGLSAADLQSLSPEDQFMRLAQGVADIQDPTERAAAAMDVFGRSGADLIPLLSSGADGIAQLRAEAVRLGASLSTAQTNMAANLTDAINRSVVATKGLVFQLGAALALAIEKAAKFMTGLVLVAQRFIKANPGLVTGLAAVSAGLIATGTAAIILGVALTGAGVAATYLGAVLGVLASPVAAIVAVVAAATAGVLYFTGAGKAMVMALVPAFENLGRTAISAFNGIADALMSGDIELAGQIVMQSLKAVFLDGMAAIVRAFQAAMKAMVDSVLKDPLISAILSATGINVAAAGSAATGDMALEGIARKFEANSRLARAELRGLQLDAAIGNRGNRASGAAGDFLGAAGGLLGGSNGFGTFSAAAAAAQGGGQSGVLEQFFRQARQLDRMIAQNEEVIRELRGLAPQFE